MVQPDELCQTSAQSGYIQRLLYTSLIIKERLTHECKHLVLRITQLFIKKTYGGSICSTYYPPPLFFLSLNIIFIINLLSTFIIENIMYSLFFFNQMFNIASFLMKCFSKVTVHVILYLTGENISWFLSVTFGGFISSTWIQLFQVFWTKNCVVNIILFH